LQAFEYQLLTNRGLCLVQKRNNPEKFQRY
jgi:hypothetical protein